MRGNANYRPAHDLGERAASEIIQDKNVLADDELALFLTDDAGTKRFVVEPEKPILMTTSNYLQQLEAAHRIQSADYIFEQVQKAGRDPPSHDIFAGHAPEIRDAVRNILIKGHE